MDIIRPRHIYYSLLRKRATVVENKLRDDKTIARTNEQVVSCAKLIKSTPNECNCLNLVNCAIYRTECKLPRTLSNYTHYEIKTVTSLDGSVVFIETTWDNAHYIPNRRYTSKYPFFMVYNDYIFVINNYIDAEPIEYISFAGIFEDPIKALACNACVGPSTDAPINGDAFNLPKCDSVYNFDFPLTGKLLDTAVQLVLQELIPNYNQIRDAYDRQTDLYAKTLQQEI